MGLRYHRLLVYSLQVAGLDTRWVCVQSLGHLLHRASSLQIASLDRSKMFALPYSVPSVEEVPFSMTLQVVPPGTKVRDSITLKKLTPTGSNRYMVHNLSLNFLPKPFAPPAEKLTATRKGNVYVDAYKPFEGIGLTAHIFASDYPKYQNVNSTYRKALASALFEQRRDVWPKATIQPRSLAAVDNLIKYAQLFTEVGPPLAPVAKDLAPIGLEMTISGWGESVHKAYMTSRVSADSKHPERVAYASYKPVAASEAEEEGIVVTKFFLVVKPAGGAEDALAVIERVPWRKDGSLYSTSPILKDEKGNEMWRKVGPQDITPGSVADAMLEDRTASANTHDGMVNKRIVIVELYIRRATPRASTRTVDGSGLPPTVILNEADTYAALEELGVQEATDAALADLDEAGAVAAITGGGAAAAAAAPAPTTPGPKHLPDPPSPPPVRTAGGLKRSRSVGGPISAGGRVMFTSYSTPQAEDDPDYEDPVCLPAPAQ